MKEEWMVKIMSVYNDLDLFSNGEGMEPALHSSSPLPCLFLGENTKELIPRPLYCIPLGHL